MGEGEEKGVEDFRGDGAMCSEDSKECGDHMGIKEISEVGPSFKGLACCGDLKLAYGCEHDLASQQPVLGAVQHETGFSVLLQLL